MMKPDMAGAEMESLRDELIPILEGYGATVVMSVLTGLQMEATMQMLELGPNEAMAVIAERHALLIGSFPEGAEKT